MDIMPKIVVIGSGIAGLFAALRLSEAGNQVTIITKERSVDSSTNWAQGGIAGILDKTDGEGKESHITDTLAGMLTQTIVCFADEWLFYQPGLEALRGAEALRLR